MDGSAQGRAESGAAVGAAQAFLFVALDLHDGAVLDDDGHGADAFVRWPPRGAPPQWEDDATSAVSPNPLAIKSARVA